MCYILNMSNIHICYVHYIIQVTYVLYINYEQHTYMLCTLYNTSDICVIYDEQHTYMLCTLYNTSDICVIYDEGHICYVHYIIQVTYVLYIKYE